MLRIAALSNTGDFRGVNEDACSLWSAGSGPLLVPDDEPVSMSAPSAVLAVYDGSGSDGPREAASHEVASLVARHLPCLMAGHGDVSRALADVVQEAGLELWKTGQSGARRGRGTTATAAALTDRTLSIAHVGDSRAYLFRAGTLTQLTRDDRLGSDMRDAGPSPEEIAANPHRSIITRALGITETIEVAASAHALQPGDLVLLCTDGLTDAADDTTIARCLTADRDLEMMCRALVEMAKQSGGRDNETVALAAVGP